VSVSALETCTSLCDGVLATAVVAQSNNVFIATASVDLDVSMVAEDVAVLYRFDTESAVVDDEFVTLELDDDNVVEVVVDDTVVVVAVVVLVLVLVVVVAVVVVVEHKTEDDEDIVKLVVVVTGCLSTVCL